jgi:ubiquinone/menaquinone biosynthesis C-methylase UbiE
MSEDPSASEPPEIDPALAAFYATGIESQRLVKVPLEFERNKAILTDCLPVSGRVLDVGGGTGIYASWLAERGYQVDLVEPIPSHVELARDAARRGAHFDAHLGEARHLQFDDQVADAVLLLGPLYCLLRSEERLDALRETLRVLRPGGVLAAAAMGRMMFFLQSIATGRIDQLGAVERVMSTIDTGVMPSGSVQFYTHRPSELFNEVASAGFDNVAVLASTGSYLGITDVPERLANPASKAALLDALRRVEADPAIVGISGKLMVVAQRPYSS